MKQRLWLPWPPTANTMFGLHGHRRFVSKTYATWKDHAGEHLLVQRPIKMEGPVVILISLKAPTRRKWDIDNRIKPILDILVTHQVIEDDNSDIVKCITAEAVTLDPPGANIILESHGAAVDTLELPE